MAPLTRVIPSAASRATSLLRAIQFTHPPTCPCHSNPTYHQPPRRLPSLVADRIRGSRKYASPAESGEQREYAFEMASSNIRFGPGVTREVGMDFKNMGAKKVCVVTDRTVDGLFAMKQVRESLDREGIEYVVFKDTRIEPKESSIKDAIEWAKPHNPDAFLAVGGGSVIDTAKLMNLYTSIPVPFLTFVNAPIGEGKPITRPLKPLIAVPTTAGTGSETTGTAIFELTHNHAKTGVSHRQLKPTLGICDPLNTATMPTAVKVASGLDVLCHALESWTAIPFDARTPRPRNPIERPAYQGANPISDVFSMHALRKTIEFLPRSVRDPEDREAQSEMLLAATLAGVGFGNAGVHLCHAMSYAISGLNPTHHLQKGYPLPHPLIPHGVSVAVTAPTVFRYTAPSNPARHLAAARAFGADTDNARPDSAGEILADKVLEFIMGLRADQPNGLGELGFRRDHVAALVEATVPQRRVLMLAPGMAGGGEEGMARELGGLFEDALERR